MVSPADEYRGTTNQVCGLWPFSAGSGSPVVGVPIGLNLLSGATVGCDPISWFQRAGLISNPSAFVLGKPGLGKSTIVRRMALGLRARGTLPLVLGDLKPDYVDLIRAMGGQVITLGRGRGHLNVLDPGGATEAAVSLRAAGAEKLANEVLEDAHARRLTMVSALIQIVRRARPTDREEAIIGRALRILDARGGEKAPILQDLLDLILSGDDDLMVVAVARGKKERYLQLVEELEVTLRALIDPAGKLGDIFAQDTSTSMLRDRPVVFDVSSIDDGQSELQAAVLLACWSYGFGAVNVANALADAGLEEQRHYLVVMDEVWRAIRSGQGMVERLDALTRLNRQRGVGQVMISHSMSDLHSLASPEDIAKAKGFVERSGMVICGGLPAAEMELLTSAVPMSRREQEMLIGWQDPPAWDAAIGREAEPPGRGHFLIKVGGRPGIPVRVQLTSVEARLNDTNKRWAQQSVSGQRPVAVMGGSR
jgi:hypothetical protein